MELLPPPYLELTWRALSTADAAELFELRRTIEEADHAFHHVSLRDLTTWLTQVRRELAAHSLVGLDAAGIMRAWGVVEPRIRPDGAAELRLHAGVHPLWRRRGVGRAIMTWLDTTASTLNPGAVATVLVDASETSRRRVLGAAGMMPTAWYSILHADLSQPQAAAVPAGLHLGPLGHHQVPCAGQVEPVFFSRFRNGPGEPEWSFDLTDDTGTSLGHILCRRREWASGAAVVEVGHIECLHVAEHLRGRKIGTALVSTAMQAMHQAGIMAAELAVAGCDVHRAPMAFASLGFKQQAAAVLYCLRLDPSAP